MKYLKITVVFASILILASVFISSSIVAQPIWDRECGPGPNWVDECEAGYDSIDYQGMLVGMDEDADGHLDFTLVMDPCADDPNTIVPENLLIVSRSDPHNGVIETEIVSMCLTTGLYTVRAGAGKGIGPYGSTLAASMGRIIESPIDDTRATSYFDVFFEVEGPQGFLYNQEEVRIRTIIYCIPPEAEYIKPADTYGLHTNPNPGEGVKKANLMRANHWVNIVPPPVFIGLSSFSTAGYDGRVEIEWTTRTEIDNAGFNIYRKGTSDGDYTKINEELIPAKGSENAGTRYSYTDSDVVMGMTYYYKLESVDLAGNSTWHGPIVITLGVTGVAGEQSTAVPTIFDLSQNYPNPFNVVTGIRYQIPEASFVTLTIYNVLGQEVRRLVGETKEAGYHAVHWDGRDNSDQEISSGIYFCRMTADNWSDTKRMVLLK